MPKTVKSVVDKLVKSGYVLAYIKSFSEEEPSVIAVTDGSIRALVHFNTTRDYTFKYSVVKPEDCKGKGSFVDIDYVRLFALRGILEPDLRELIGWLMEEEHVYIG